MCVCVCVWGGGGGGFFNDLVGFLHIGVILINPVAIDDKDIRSSIVTHRVDNLIDPYDKVVDIIWAYFLDGVSNNLLLTMSQSLSRWRR